MPDRGDGGFRTEYRKRAREPVIGPLRPDRALLSNRSSIAIASIVVQLALGTVYASSEFILPIMGQYGVSKLRARSSSHSP